MKKLALAFLLVSLSSCAALKKDEKDKPTTADKQKNSRLIDLCSSENMPRYPYRPKLYPQELKNLSDEKMDARIRQHIKDLDAHIDKVEAVVVETRQRVELCR